MEGLVSTPADQLHRGEPQPPAVVAAAASAVYVTGKSLAIAATQEGGAVVGTNTTRRSSQEHAEEPYMLHPPHPCAPSTPAQTDSSSSPSASSASFSGADLTTCLPVGEISTYPTFPCKREFVCNPKPAFPEVDLHDVDAKVLPPVKLIQGTNYQVGPCCLFRFRFLPFLSIFL